MTLHRTALRAVSSAALITAFGLVPAHAATAAPAGDRQSPAGVSAGLVPGAHGDASGKSFKGGPGDGGWHGDGLDLNAADNKKVDAFLLHARRAERSISPQVKAAAAISHAQVIGFDHRLKSADSLKRKVATAMKETPGRTVDQTLAGISDSVRYTLQWPDGRYTSGVALASSVLAGRGDDSVKWSNTWSRPKGYKGVNSSWKEPRSGHVFEVQFHTPESKRAQEDTHKLYEEQRLPTTSPERKKELQAQQDAIFAAVPVPAGAPELTAPASRRHPAHSARPAA
ncbi:ATP nucleotide 3'-pyrophosphokinase [Streptomyces hesseae]|uniref:ATP nucleotide 3'-pyrophosphokinase n=1 Tax=Streptomyces hesseae TaxID=3075519 RepID=A0ABU2SFD7_9ACTN|nr:ATP nucleotide 3'-pyrophosphokinase [Streptomyces sp. DSM 40473]MDT0447683.1 ATP nucleotide 3'-pyrophosphokinase [Streptomyces sp. DSM 40473]